jgi:hypothetical protein
MYYINRKKPHSTDKHMVKTSSTVHWSWLRWNKNDLSTQVTIQTYTYHNQTVTSLLISPSSYNKHLPINEQKPMMSQTVLFHSQSKILHWCFRLYHVPFQPRLLILFNNLTLSIVYWAKFFVADEKFIITKLVSKKDVLKQLENFYNETMWFPRQFSAADTK